MADEVRADDLFFGGLVSKAAEISMLGMIEEICHQVGYVDPDGLSVDDRFHKQRKIELEKLFRDLENVAPALAARLHERFEKARDEIGDDRI